MVYCSVRTRQAVIFFSSVTICTPAILQYRMPIYTIHTGRCKMLCMHTAGCPSKMHHIISKVHLANLNIWPNALRFWQMRVWSMS